VANIQKDQNVKMVDILTSSPFLLVSKIGPTLAISSKVSLKKRKNDLTAGLLQQAYKTYD
jgi:hypothetical protein